MLVGSTNKGRYGKCCIGIGIVRAAGCVTISDISGSACKRTSIYLRIMPRGNKISAVSKGLLGKGTKLNSLIAHNIGVWRIAARVGIDKIVNNCRLILLLAIPHVEREPQRNTYALSISQIVGPPTGKTG